MTLIDAGPDHSDAVKPCVCKKPFGSFFNRVSSVQLKA